jgi:FkbM family methyltransferase
MIANIKDGDYSYQLYLPNSDTDHLQRLIKNMLAPYEVGMLRDMASRLDKTSVVLDIGANIGNHSIYLSYVSGCSVICFEPDKNLTEAIKYSAELNSLLDKIKIYQVAVGSRNTKCEIKMSEDKPESVGSQQVVADSGNIDMIKLDGLQLGKVDCMKIDVEGFEREVLLGAKKLIKKNKPIIYIEAWNKEYLDDILDILSPIGYNIQQRFNATPTYLLTTN